MGCLTRERIDVTALLAAVADAGRGGTVTFLGSVRQGPDDGPVEAIEYSAYEAMAEEECARLLAEAGRRWPHVGVALQHRLGLVPLGEPSIAIVAAAPHRADAFEVCRWLIEEAKRRLPVWKQERFPGGGARWRED